MANNNMEKDLSLGQKSELLIKDYLVKKGLTFVHQNNNNRYDLKMLKNEKELTYEVKTDFFCSKASDSGNLLVEFFSYRKASGILTTKSDWYVFYFIFLDEVWIIKTNELRKLLLKYDFPIKFDCGDKNSETTAYAIERKKFKKYFIVEQYKPENKF